MDPSPPRPTRRSLRLQGYDYAQPGAYFVTIVTQEHSSLFGTIDGDAMVLNDAGRMIEKWWLELNQKFADVETDEYMVMPNHFHGIILIESEVGVSNSNTAVGGDPGASLSTVIQWFKTMTTNEYIRGVKHRGWTPFVGKLWQRNYYDRIIRNDGSLCELRRYIEDNPLQWALDAENPQTTRRGP